MKTRTQYRLIIRRSVVTTLALSIAITQWVVLSRGSEALAFNVEAKPSAIHLQDDVDELVQAARNGITTLNASNNGQIDEVKAALEAFAAGVAGQENLTALAAVAAEIRALAETIKALRDQIIALRNQIENLDQKFNEVKAKAKALDQCSATRRTLLEEYDRLLSQLRARIAEAEARNQSTTALKQELVTLQNRRAEALEKLEKSCARVLSEIEKLEDQVKKTAKARKILDKLSVDRAKASQFLQLIRTNNRTGLSEFLQREAGGGDFVISDAKVSNGPLVIFRVDSISHCLSAGSQCSGKPYVFTR